jgi:hypothetical protein
MCSSNAVTGEDTHMLTLPHGQRSMALATISSSMIDVFEWRILSSLALSIRQQIMIYWLSKSVLAWNRIGSLNASDISSRKDD